MIYNRIEVVNATLAQLAADETKRAEFKNALNEYGKNDWEPVQFEQVGQTLLIFLRKQGA